MLAWDGTAVYGTLVLAMRADRRHCGGHSSQSIGSTDKKRIHARRITPVSGDVR